MSPHTTKIHGEWSGMRLAVVHLCKNFGIKTSSKLHIPSENTMQAATQVGGKLLAG